MHINISTKVVTHLLAVWLSYRSKISDTRHNFSPHNLHTGSPTHAAYCLLNISSLHSPEMLQSRTAD